MRKYLCKLGIHRYVSLDITDTFTTKYTDTGCTIKHVVWYQQCSCCGKRRLKDRYKKDTPFNGGPHAGIELARIEWVNNGFMYLGNGITIGPTAPEPTKKTKLRVFQGGKP